MSKALGLEISRISVAYFSYRLFRNCSFHIAILTPFYVFHGLSFTEVVLLDVVYLSAQMLTDVPTGIFADLISRRLSLILGTASVVAAYLLMINIPVLLSFIIAEILMGVGQGFESGADSALVFDGLKSSGQQNEYPKIEGVGWAIRSIALTIAPIIGGIASDNDHFVAPIMLSAAAAILSIPPLFAIPEQRDLRSSFRRHKSNIRSESWAAVASPIFFGFILVFGVIFASTQFGFWAFQKSLIDFAVDTKAYGVLFAVFFVTSALVSMQVDRIIRLAGTHVLSALLGLLIIFGVMASAGIFLGGIVGFALAFLGFGCHAIVRGVQDPLLRIVINATANSTSRATSLSIAATGSKLVFVLIGAPLAWIAEAQGLHISLLIVSGLGCVALLFIRYLSRSKSALFNAFNYDRADVPR